MEEQASWKGHAFTLLVFGGIVFLCSIFFVLGMLVGRGQGQRSSEAAAGAAAKARESSVQNQPPEVAPGIAPFENVKTGQAKTPDSPHLVPVVPEPPAAVPSKPAPQAAPAPPKAPPPAVAPAAAPAPVPVKMTYLQLFVLEKKSAADGEFEKLKKQGFSAIIFGPEGDKKIYRVQVGPFSNAADAATAKTKLESLGYKPIKK